MAISLLFVGAAHAQEGGYVPPVVDIEPIVIEATPWLDVLTSFQFGLREGAFFVAIMLPIILTLLMSYILFLWVKSRFREPETHDRKHGRALGASRNILEVSTSETTASSGTVVINISGAGTSEPTDDGKDEGRR